MSGRAYVSRAERVNINGEFASVEEHINEYVTNISTTGAFIRSRDPLPIGTRVNLRFSILAEEIETIEGIGEVVRVQSAPSGMGVMFRSLSDSSRELIERLCANHPKHERRA